jgi:hypothetical protein
MRVSLFLWGVFALLGNIAGVSSMFEGVAMSEPVRLALWGVTLIGFSSSLRSAISSKAAAPRRVEPPQSLGGRIATSLARPA